MEVNSLETLKEFVIKRADKIVVVEYNSTTCLPCIRFNPKWNEYKQKYTEVEFLRLSVDDYPEIGRTAEVTTLPTFHFFKRGEWVDNLIGGDHFKFERRLEHLLNDTIQPFTDSFNLTSSSITTTGEAPLFNFSQSFIVHSQMYILPYRTSIPEEFDDVEAIYLENIYVLDLTKYEWSSIPAKGDIPLYFPLQMALVHNKIYCFSHQFDSIYTLDLATFEWKNHKVEGELPSVCHNGRRGYSITTKDSSIIMFGGGCDIMDDRFQDLYVFDIDSMKWALVNCSGQAPSSRQFHSTCKYNDHLYIFGGESGGAELFEFNDVFKLNLNEMVWEEVKCIGNKPSPRMNSIATIVEGHYMLVMGGQYDYKELSMSETLLLDLETNTWVNLNAKALEGIELGPLGLNIQALSPSVIFCFGGTREEQVFNSCFECQLSQ